MAGTSTILYSFMILAVVTLMSTSAIAETRVEVSFTVNPVSAGGQTAFRCDTWKVGPSQGVGISRSVNGANSVLVRNGGLLPSAPDHVFLDILPPQNDGSTPYLLTIAGVDEAEDGGLYSCTVLTMVGEVNAVAAASAMLEITPAPDEYLPPDSYPTCSVAEQKLSFVIGDTASFICTSLDGKPAISLIWLQNDRMKIPDNQTTRREGNYVVTTLTETLNEEDNGAMFICVVGSQAFPTNDQRCSIGPIAVWESSAGNSNGTDTGMEPGVRRILGLTETTFVIIVVAVGTFLLVAIILCIVYCVRAYSCSCLIKRKSYNMNGEGIKDRTIRRDGTLSAGIELQYVPTRPAPAAPPDMPRPPSYSESQLDTQLQMASQSQRAYEKNISAPAAPFGGNVKNKRLSTVETALLMAVSKSLTRSQGRALANKHSSIRENPDSEIIYANTSRSSSVVDLSHIVRDDDEDSGVVNTGYDDSVSDVGYPVFANEPVTSPPKSHKRSISQSEAIYHNTADLPIHTSSSAGDLTDIPLYARVDKSRTSTMESVKSVKKEKPLVTPEAVSTLDADAIYHNTADLGLNPGPSSPPPIPTSIPPVSPSPKTASKRPDYKRQMSSTSLGRPSFKPPPPPAAAASDPDPASSIYQNTDFVVAGSTHGGTSTPPVPPEKPSYDI